MMILKKNPSRPPNPGCGGAARAGGGAGRLLTPNRGSGCGLGVALWGGLVKSVGGSGPPPPAKMGGAAHFTTNGPELPVSGRPWQGLHPPPSEPGHAPLTKTFADPMRVRQKDASIRQHFFVVLSFNSSSFYAIWS